MIAHLLTEMLKKGSFKWSLEAEESFKALKQALISSPVLILPDLSKPFEVEADASQFGIGVVLTQEKHPVAFIRKKLSIKNQVLSVYDKELLALIYAVEKWHSYLAIQPFVIRTDQKSLRFLLEQKLSTPSQFGWLAKLMGMTYEIKYKKGSENNATDALSRATHSELLQMTLSSISSELWEGIKKELNEDPKLVKIIAELEQQTGQPTKYRWANGILSRKGKLVIGSKLHIRKAILEWLHTSPQGGHSGVRATLKRIKSLFYWKGMLCDIKDFIFSCEPCLICKNETIASPGSLQPLPVPPGVWHSIAMDFIEGLPKSNKVIIWVIIDRFSKYGHFIALSHPYNAEGLAKEFMDKIYKLHGSPANIVSDRDPIFVSRFWREFLG